MVGSYKCKGKRSQICNNITETDSFNCSNDQLNFKINHRLDCHEKFLIYLIMCNRCLKQNVGQTVDEFRHRWNNYKDNTRKFERGEQCMQRHLYEHFNLPGHSGFLNDVSITLIDKTDLKDPTKQEDFWIQFKPLQPKLHWDITLKMVFRCNSLYFASLIIFMDRLFLDNGFRTRFPYFIIRIAVVFDFAILLLLFFLITFILLLLLLLLLFFFFFFLLLLLLSLLLLPLLLY